MSGCRDCVKGHCDRWDHLIKIVRGQSSGFEKPMVGIVKVSQGGGFVDPSTMSVRLAAGLLSVARRLDEAIQRLDAVPAKMSDEEVPRCACGGLFQPSSAGVMTCDCCGAAWADHTAEAVDTDVGRTLTEVLLAGRRRGNPKWTPSDDDVKVTLHE